MSFVVEDGTGRSDSNSYASVAYATTYHDDHGDDASWDSATTAQKERALRLATQYLDARYSGRWPGYRINSTMSLSWPRKDVEDSDGYAVDSASVPVAVKEACAELALRVIKGDVLLADQDEPQTLAAESVTVGPISESKTYASAKTTVPSYPLVSRILSKLLGPPNSIHAG